MAKLNIAKINALCSKNMFLLTLLIVLLLVVILALLIDTRVKDKFTSDTTGEKLVLYHLNGCHHCTELMPIWNELKKTHGAHMEEYEATAHPELMKRHNITSFPTIMKGKREFKGERTSENLKAFLMN
jgi:glutaredoxin